MWEREAATWPHHELSRFIEAGGVRWHVQQTGSGPRLLLIHGTAASTHSWRDVMPILASSFTVLAVDLPGHGFSAACTAAQSSIVGLSDLLSILLKEMQFEPVFVVGHSAGAVLLCNMAIARQINPHLIVSINGAFLPLVGTASALFTPLAKLLATSPFMPRLLARRAINRDNVARVLESTGSHLDAAGIDLYARLVRQPAHVLGALQMMSQWDLGWFLKQLPSLTQRLALMVASNDKAVPLEQAFEVMQLVRDATLYPLNGLGHLAHEEDPKLIAGRITEICRMPDQDA